MNGSTALTTEEWRLLARQYDLDLNQLFGLYTDRVAFTFPSLGSLPDNPVSYLGSILKDFELLANISSAKLTYITRELPLFYFFSYPDLAFFKLYIYQNSVWENSERRFESFEVYSNRNREITIGLMEQLRYYYFSLDTLEYWSEAIFQNTIHQIKYGVEAHLFDKKETIDLLMKQLRFLNNDLMEMTAGGRKGTPGGELDLYYHELLHLNNTIVVESEEYNSIYLTYDNPNYLVTRDEKMMERTKLWLHKLNKKSYHVTRGSDIASNKLFKQVIENLGRAEEEIKILKDRF